MPFLLLAERKTKRNFERKKRTSAASHSPLREFSHKTRAKIPIEFLYRATVRLIRKRFAVFSLAQFSVLHLLSSALGS